MQTLLQQLTEPFERLTEAGASAIVRKHWGVEPERMHRLDTERDDSFHVVAPSGREYVLKVAHPLDGARLVGMQTAALRHVGRAGLPVQLPVPSAGGAVVVHGRIARLLSWIPGGLMRDASFGLPEFAAAGATLARLDAALSDFDDPAAHRTFAWDLQSFGQLEHGFDSVAADFARLDLAALPHQVIHNDFHPGNLLVDTTDPGWITGILDFGDMVYAPRVQDLAVALAYLVAEDPDSTIAAFVDGYATPLLDAELDALRPLIAARLVQRIVIPPLLGTHDAEHIARLTRILERL